MFCIEVVTVGGGGDCSCDGKFSFGRVYLNSKKKGYEVKKMSGLIITLLVLKEGLGIRLM